ncbi:OLC1v1014218C1 [Oldenlandia corymbosa var. corymbosa]|uniref:OLC1v1014218C1 n=1 Tax=Oldenlandia corymbosa var. corymbosa TaxID=529605 RepID=A0AAV1E060_OLDCO|nr:OLC1v1014218C1 [Oldenlandia corymbosa var. corymbosa]
MALNGNQILYNTPTATSPPAGIPLRRTFLIPSWHWSSPKTHNLTIVSATRMGKFDSKNRKNTIPTKEEEEEEAAAAVEGTKFKDIDSTAAIDGGAVDGVALPELPGETTDFWEGPQWDAFGFFIQYLWAFGVVFALVACGVAVVTYNQGATDFKDTPVYKEAVQSRDLLEEPDSSNADVFESNPTEQAPDLE